MFRMGDTNDVATGAADFILEGDDEPASGMQELSDGGEESLLEHSFNAPAGWAPASSRAGWGGEAGTGAGAWDLSQGLSQGSSVNIEKAFGAFNGVGNNSVLGGLAYGIPASKSNLVWSGSMMGIGDLANDWQLNNEGDENAGLRMPQGWSAPPPDSFASVGDVGGESQRSGHPDRDKGRGGRNKPRDPKGGGGGGRGGQKSRAVDPSADWSSKSSENGDPDAGANIAARGGRSVGRQQSANAQSRNKRGGERGGRPSSAYAEGLGAVPKLEGADKAMEGEGGSRVGGRSSRGKARGSASRPAMLAVPENIRLAAQDMVKQSQEGPPP